MITIAHKLSVAGAAALLAIGLAGCSMGGELIPDALKPNADSSTETQDSGSSEQGNDGRAFDSTDDAVIIAVTAALKADDVKWEGKTLKAYFNEGSVDDPTATIGCLAMQTLIADDEVSFVVYPDGEFDCSTMH